MRGSRCRLLWAPPSKSDSHEGVGRRFLTMHTMGRKAGILGLVMVADLDLDLDLGVREKGQGEV